MPPDPTQPIAPPEPAQTPAEPQSAPVIASEPTPAPTEPIPASTADSTTPKVPPEAPEAPRTLDASISDNVPEPIPTTSEPQNPPTAPISAPVEPPPAPQPTVVIQRANPRSFLAKALEKIQFRKRAKLEKIVKLATEKKSITNDQVQKLLYVSDATASRYLAQLVRDGKLQKIGKDGSSRYEVVTL